MSLSRYRVWMNILLTVNKYYICTYVHMPYTYIYNTYIRCACLPLLSMQWLQLFPETSLWKTYWNDKTVYVCTCICKALLKLYYMDYYKKCMYVCMHTCYNGILAKSRKKILCTMNVCTIYDMYVCMYVHHCRVENKGALHLYVRRKGLRSPTTHGSDLKSSRRLIFFSFNKRHNV